MYEIKNVNYDSIMELCVMTIKNLKKIKLHLTLKKGEKNRKKTEAFKIAIFYQKFQCSCRNKQNLTIY